MRLWRLCHLMALPSAAELSPTSLSAPQRPPDHHRRDAEHDAAEVGHGVPGVARPVGEQVVLEQLADRGVHGHQGSSELRLRGWALLQNFRPYAPRSNRPRAHDSPAHRLNGKRYHEHWLHNLMASTSLMGFRNHVPAIR